MPGRDTNEKLMSLDELLRLIERDSNKGKTSEGSASEGPGSREERKLDEQDVSLEKLIRQARQKAVTGITQSTVSDNKLLNAQARRLVQLISLVARIAPIRGAGGELGFTDPRTALAAKLKGLTADDIDMWELDRMFDMADEAATLWEGQRIMQGLPLARNALLYAVFGDEQLCEDVFRRAEQMLEKFAEICEQSSLKLT